MRAWLRPKAPTPTTATLIKLSLSLLLSVSLCELSQGSAGVPPAVRRASRPPIGPAGGRRYAAEPESDCSRLLEQGDLAGMIKLMLHDAAEHVVEVVVVLGLSRNLFRQARIGE